MVPTPQDIFSLKYIFCPININNSHWTLAVIFMEAKKIQYYDSCGKTDMGLVLTLAGALFYGTVTFRKFTSV